MKGKHLVQLKKWLGMVLNAVIPATQVAEA
jgi:hypothetical protein